MIARAKTDGPGKRIKFVRRKQKRLPRKVLESPQQDWDRWEHAAELEGINFTAFARRALEQRSSSVLELAQHARRANGAEVKAAFRSRLPGLSEKGPSKEVTAALLKSARAGAAGKAAIRTKGGR